MLKCTKIHFRLGFRPRPRWGSLQRSPRPLAGFKGAYPVGLQRRTSAGPALATIMAPHWHASAGPALQ